MARFIEPVTLRGQHALLEPLRPEHEAEVQAAVADGELWKLWYTSVPAPDQVRAWTDTALQMREQQGAMPFVIREVRDGVPGAVVGATRYFNVDGTNRRLEIGHTWHAQRVQRSAVNTECKLMLLTHAFEQLACIAVEFRTHWMNHQSRTAIARLGAGAEVQPGEVGDAVRVDEQRDCPDRKPPFSVVKQPAFPYRSPKQNLFPMENAEGA